jgi:hypothetical protein
MLKTVIKNLRSGKKKNDGTVVFLGLIDIFHQHLLHEFRDSKATWLQSYILNRSHKYHIPQQKILNEIATEAAYTLLFQQVIEHINRVESKSSLQNPCHFFTWDGMLSYVSIPQDALTLLSERLQNPELQKFWSDSLTLGWVYQFWNDPVKKIIDEKIKDGGKVENNEIASKTQLFTERYMVDWTLQNTLGMKWFAICKRNDWKPAVLSNGTLDKLHRIREDWKRKRENGEVSRETPIPLKSLWEENWVYFIRQSLTEEDVLHAPSSVRNIRILDPSCGSGHFLVIAVDYLYELYLEEKQHRIQNHTIEESDPNWTNHAIVERIISHNLYGLDIDAKAIQVAKAALFVKAKEKCPQTESFVFNVVSSNLGLERLNLVENALVELKNQIYLQTGISKKDTHFLIEHLTKATYLGTLLQINTYFDLICKEKQYTLKSIKSCLNIIQNFLERENLGLETFGEMRHYVEVNCDGKYDIVVGNPPYLGQAVMSSKEYIETYYSEGKEDLYATFMMRSLQLCKKTGLSGLITQRGWMFTSAYQRFRNYMNQFQLYLLADLNSGAFEFCKGGMIITNTIAIYQKQSTKRKAIVVQPKPLSDIKNEEYKGRGILHRNDVGLQCHNRIFEYDTKMSVSLPLQPYIYWWSPEQIEIYQKASTIQDLGTAKVGMQTNNNTRFIRYVWEVSKEIYKRDFGQNHQQDFYTKYKWAPYIKGAKQKMWLEPLEHIVNCKNCFLEIELIPGSRVQNKNYYFKKGISYSTIGNTFRTRVHRYRSVFDVSGASVFLDNIDAEEGCCSLNSRRPTQIVQDLNPTQNFQVSDIKRIPFVPNQNYKKIFGVIQESFDEHESHRETSVDFNIPGPSCWKDTQQWAQQVIDCPNASTLPKYNPQYETELDINHLSYALGIALGRFKPDGSGIANSSKDNLDFSLPSGYLFLHGGLSSQSLDDSLGHVSCQKLHKEWKNRRQKIIAYHKNKYNSKVNTDIDLRNFLQRYFFRFHLDMYKKRPIYWPLTSQDGNFVVWVNIHRMKYSTFLSIVKELKTTLVKWPQYHVEELRNFIAILERCIEKGPDERMEQEAQYNPNLDDGVMINSAALYPLLHPQWNGKNAPKEWWNKLCSEDKKNFDWSYLSRCYFPNRIEEKCLKDLSLALAHGCLGKYHPQIAKQWKV